MRLSCNTKSIRALFWLIVSRNITTVFTYQRPGQNRCNCSSSRSNDYARCFGRNIRNNTTDLVGHLQSFVKEKAVAHLVEITRKQPALSAGYSRTFDGWTVPIFCNCNKPGEN